MFRRFLATLVCFMCIAIWHLPLTPALIMWISLNVIGAFVEIWARALSQTSVWAGFRAKVSRANYLRLLAIISLPLFVLAIVSNLFFLAANEQVPHEFARRIFANAGNFTLGLMFVLYCGANVSLDYNRMVESSVDFAKTESKETTSKQSSGKQSSKKNL